MPDRAHLFDGGEHKGGVLPAIGAHKGRPYKRNNSVDMIRRSD